MSLVDSRQVQLRDERDRLTAAVQSLESLARDSQHAKEVPQEEDVPSNGPSAAEVTRWREERELQLQEIFRLQNELNEKDSLVAELRKKVPFVFFSPKSDEASKLAQQQREVQDEIDILREKAALVDTLEERVKKFQKRAETVNDLKRQVTLLEEQNDLNIKAKIESEESSKKLSALKVQLDRYKEQVTSLTAEKSTLRSSLEEKGSPLVIVSQQMASSTS